MLNSLRFLTIVVAAFLALFSNVVSAEQNTSVEIVDNTTATQNQDAIAPEILKAKFKSGVKNLSDYFQTGEENSFLLARVMLDSILAKQPKNEKALMLLGMLYTKKAQNIADSVAASNDVPDSAQFQLGNLFLSQNRFEEAVKCYEKCNAAMPKWSCPFRHKGEALLRMGKAEEAIKALEMAIETRKNHFDAYVFLAEAQLYLSQFENTEKTLAQAIEVAKDSGMCKPSPGEAEVALVDVYKLYVALYTKSGETAKRKNYEKILAKLGDVKSPACD